MIAYNKKELTNLLVLNKVKEWRKNNLISKEQYYSALSQYKSNFYNPNIFIKLGLYIFTLIALSSGFGILSLLLSVFRSEYYYVICFLYAIICIVALEYSIRNTNHYKSGIQQALLYSALCFLIPLVRELFFTSFDNSNSILFLSIISLPILSITIIRYCDRLVSILLMISIYSAYFLLIMKLGDIAKLIMPFAFMLLSAVIYFWILRIKTNEQSMYWNDCITVFECLAPIVFYASGNYYVIREASIKYFDMHLTANQDIPLARFFYLFTALVPFSYLFFGLKRKNKIILWLGLLLIVASVFTFKHYFHFHHYEVKLTIAGFIVTLIASLIIKFLKVQRYGITFEESYGDSEFFSSNAEAILIAQSFSPSTHQKSYEYGGGTSSGGGATDSW